MNDRQKAARAVMERFVAMQGGDPAAIQMVGNEYRGTASDGKTACIGWKP